MADVHGIKSDSTQNSLVLNCERKWQFLYLVFENVNRDPIYSGKRVVYISECVKECALTLNEHLLHFDNQFFSSCIEVLQVGCVLVW